MSFAGYCEHCQMPFYDGEQERHQSCAAKIPEPEKPTWEELEHFRQGVERERRDAPEDYLEKIDRLSHSAGEKDAEYILIHHRPIIWELLDRLRSSHPDKERLRQELMFHLHGRKSLQEKFDHVFVRNCELERKVADMEKRATSLLTEFVHYANCGCIEFTRGDDLVARVYDFLEAIGRKPNAT